MVPAPDRRRVVITGLGAITPLGLSVDDLWDNALAGRSGTRELTRFESSNYPSRVGGEVLNFDPAAHMAPHIIERTARFTQFAIAAAGEALRHAAFELDGGDPRRAGVICGNGTGGAPEAEVEMRRLVADGSDAVDPLHLGRMLPNFGPGNVAAALGFLGYNNSIVTACAAGTQAIGEAVEVIRRGAADVMVAGGTEAALSEIAHAGFCSMRALATSSNDDPGAASRPFDQTRDGFVIAEGAGMVVLERLDLALERGVEPLAEVLGYGVSADAAHLVAPGERGAGAARAIRTALDDAAIDAGEVDYISAHATATPTGDLAETQALRSALGEHAYEIPVSALKSQTGHMLGGSGAVETVTAVQTIRTGAIAPTINLTQPDPECDLDYVPGDARDADVRTVMKNSFGFGGQNAVLILRRYEG
ncbi:MAG: beta-ketoacyl-ACP synthase II [Dehalococcoidia bacterium]